MPEATLGAPATLCWFPELGQGIFMSIFCTRYYARFNQAYDLFYRDAPAASFDVERLIYRDTPAASFDVERFILSRHASCEFDVEGDVLSRHASRVF
jgi:hypothetical protein